MKISIITVCKNAEDAIERTLFSVVSQNCFNENIEYIVVDGASTDKTVDIIKQYADKYPIKWISEPDSGIYNAMNKGIKLASGDYLLFLNAGDYLIHYNVIKLLMDTLECGKYDVIYGNELIVTPFSGECFIKDESILDLDAYFFYQNALPHQAMFYKRDLFDKFGGYEEKFRVVSDNLLNKKLICDKKVSIKHVDFIVSVFMKDGISSTNDKLDSQERKIFQKNYFTEEEQQRLETRISRQRKKSILRFIAKILIKIHESWVNR